MKRDFPNTGSPDLFGRADSSVLIVAHPGHELRVHGWLERARPRVLVLTDGSGRTGQSRLPCTSRILEAAGARPGGLYGRLTDPEFYVSVMNGDLDLFAELAREVARELTSPDVASVVADAAEGYNPAHDICRLLTDAAVSLANSGREVPLKNYDFLLNGPGTRDSDRTRVIALGLTPDAFQRKLAAARSYIRLDAEVEAALKSNGEEAFRTEYLRPVPEGIGWQHEDAPFYEAYGVRQVAAGRYSRVLRYREHVRPIEEALQSLARDRGAFSPTCPA